MAMEMMRNISEYESSEGSLDSEPASKPPSPPQGPLIVQKRTDSIVDLKWKPPLDQGTSPVLLYTIQRQKFTEDDWTSIACVLGKVTRAFIRLKEAVPHRFRVIAANAHGRSEPLVADGHVMGSSKESSRSVAIAARIRELTGPPLSSPSAPTGPLTIYWVSAAKVLLSWRPPATDGGSPIQSYMIECSPESLTAWLPLVCVPGNITSVLVESPDTRHLFRVIAVNMHGGYSIPLVTEAYVTQFGNVVHRREVPSALTIFRPSSHTGPLAIEQTPNGSSAVLSWEPPFYHGASPVVSYYGNTLPLGSQGICQVRSPKSRIEVDAALSQECIEIKWTIPLDTRQPCAGEKFNIRKRVGSSEFEMIAMDLMGDSYRDFAVVRGQSYQYEVVATDSYEGRLCGKTLLVKFGEGQQQASNGGEQSWSPPLQVKNPVVPSKDKAMLLESKLVKDKDITIPAPPEGPLTVHRVTERSISISWKPPSNTDNSPITSYIIECCNTRAHRFWSPIKEVPGSCTTGLTEITVAYQAFRIIAENDAGRSEPSQVVAFPKLRPPPPQAKAGTQPNCIMVMWSVPENAFPTYAKVDSFRIRKSNKVANGGQTKFVELHNDVKANSYCDTDLVPGQMYQYELISFGSKGFGKSKRTLTEWVKFGLAQEPMVEESASKSQSNVSAGPSAQCQG